MQDTDKPMNFDSVTKSQLNASAKPDFRIIPPVGTPPAEMPETMVINGVTYRREADDVDELVNIIQKFKTVARRSGVSLRQAVWFNQRDSSGLLPD